MQSARPYPPRPTIAYVKELTALEASFQRQILREWLAQSENASPASPLSLADDYDDFVITTVRDRPKATPKVPAWTFAVGALPVAVIVLVLAHVGRGSAPLPSPRPLFPNVVTTSTLQTAAVLVETPPIETSEVAARPTPTATPANKSPSTRAAAATARPAVRAVPVPEADPELVANSDFGGRK